jgi:hypothetical protein
MEQKRKAVDAAQAELDAAKGNLLHWEEKVLVAEAELREAIQQADADLDGRQRETESKSNLDVQVVTSTLETQMSRMLHTMSQMATTFLSGTATDGETLRLQLATWVQEIQKLPLQAKVKQEAEAAAASTVAAAARGRGNSPPPTKQRRRVGDTSVRAGVHSTDDERGYQSAGSMSEVAVVSSGDEKEGAATQAHRKQKATSEVDAADGESERERSRSPPPR